MGYESVLNWAGLEYRLVSRSKYNSDMDSRKVSILAAYCALLVWGLVLIALSGCASSVENVGPTQMQEETAGAIEPPQVPENSAGAAKPAQAPEQTADIMVNVSPGDVALTRSDMPAGFQLAAEKGSGAEYVALYLRPAALDPEASGGNALLSVLTSVAVYTTTAEAEQVYLEASADPAEQAVEDIELLSDAATDIVSEPFEAVVEGVDESEAHRVTYNLMGRRVFEYGHRVRVGNVLAYVVVAAVGDPDEPQYLVEDARGLVQRQIDHIVDTGSQNVTN